MPSFPHAKAIGVCLAHVHFASLHMREGAVEDWSGYQWTTHPTDAFERLYLEVQIVWSM